MVAWQEGEPTVKNVYVKRWDGTAWQLAGTGFLNVSAIRDAVVPSLALDLSGNPVVAWEEYDLVTQNIFVKRLNGTAWQLVGTTSLNVNPSRGVNSPSLKLDSSGKPIVAWNEEDGTSQNIYVKRWDANAWQPMGSGFLDANVNQPAFSPSLALDTTSGNPSVAWFEYDGSSFNVYVSRFKP